MNNDYKEYASKNWVKEQLVESVVALEGALENKADVEEVFKKLDIATIKAGTTWTASTMPISSYWESVTYGDDKFVAVADGSTKAAYSTDGVSWNASTMPSYASWLSVTYGDGKFVAGANGKAAAYSESATRLSQSGEDVTSEVSDVLGVNTKADKNHTHDASALILTDTATGTKYKLIVTNSELNIVEIA